MKKIQNPLLAACPVVMLTFIPVLNEHIQAGPVVWVVMSVLALLIGVTIFFLFKNILSAYHKNQEFMRSQTELIAEKVSTLKNDCFEIISKNSADFENRLNELSDMQKSYSKKTEGLVDSMRIRIDELNNIVSKLAKDDAAFQKELSEKNSAYLDRINSSIEKLLNNNSEFAKLCDELLSSMKDISHDLTAASTKLTGTAAEMTEENKELLSELSRQFIEENTKLREKTTESFAELNKICAEQCTILKDVQQSNSKTIADSHEKFRELADLSEKHSKQLIDFAKSTVISMDSIKQIIEKGNTEAGSNRENFKNDVATQIGSLGKKFENCLNDYNVYIDDISKKIAEVMEAVKENTSNYNSTLKSITDSRNAMNKLTEKDVRLLEQLLERK